MNVEQITYKGWDKCYLLSNDELELIVTADVGPRIIHFSRKGADNVFLQVAEDLGKTGGDEFRIYGGHRLWHAPEVKPRTYQADNAPVDYFELDNIHYFVPPLEEKTGVQKQISLSLSSGTLIVDHTFTNNGMWSLELSPWALTILKPGGVGIMPLPPHISHGNQLQPTHAITLWGYTSLNDSRLHFGNKYIWVEQKEEAAGPLKIGLQVNFEYLWSVGWLAYVNQNTMFVKSFLPPLSAMEYPDLDTQLEIFTDNKMIELETLGAIRRLEPDETITHREYWSLHDNVAIPHNDAEIGADILPLVRQFHPNVGRRQTGSLGSFA
jgi:hypothetical protein